MVLYISLNIIRGLSVILAYPVLNRGPYGINWRQALILWYGGLRGAVGKKKKSHMHDVRPIHAHLSCTSPRYRSCFFFIFFGWLFPFPLVTMQV